MFVKPGTLVALFTLLGLAVRLYRLDARGLWFDEVTFAYSVRLNTPGEVLHLNSLFGDQSPLSFFLTWLVRGLGGSEWVVRLPFVIAGTLTIPAIYLLGRELARPRVGLVAALLFALSPFAVFYSQDAHPYAPLLLFTTLQMLFAYRAAAYGRWHDWASLCVASILNLYNDYIGLITSAVVALFVALALLGKAVVVIRHRGPGPRDTAPLSITPRQLGVQFVFAVGTLAAITLAYLPWLPSVETFFSIPNSGFDRLPKGVHGTLADMQALAHGFGFDKLLVALLSIGTLYAIITLVRERTTFEPPPLYLDRIAAGWLLAASRRCNVSPQGPLLQLPLPSCVVLIAIRYRMSGAACHRAIFVSNAPESAWFPNGGCRGRRGPLAWRCDLYMPYCWCLLSCKLRWRWRGHTQPRRPCRKTTVGLWTAS